MNREIENEIKKHTNADGSTNWAKLESGEAHEFFRFERVGQAGFGSIESQNGKWFVVADNGSKSQSRETTRDNVLATIAKIKSQPSVFTIIHDFSKNI